MDITKMAFMAVTDPKLITVDFDHLERMLKEQRAKLDAANPPEPEPERAEYNRLRQQLYGLQEQAKNCEVYANNKAGEVRHFEQSINDLLTQKKKAIADGVLGEERKCEHQIQLLEAELITAKQEFQRAKVQSGNAARLLRRFDGRSRLAELKAILDAPAKSDSVPK